MTPQSVLWDKLGAKYQGKQLLKSIEDTPVSEKETFGSKSQRL